jgi:hypothetical protein
MPRGNKSGNANNSPFIPDGNISATPEDLRELSRHALELFDQKPPDLHNAEEVRQAIRAYFQSCDRHGVRPANLGLYAALGLSKQDVSNILTGKSKSKVSPECIDLLKKCKQVLSTYRESLAMTGKLNPVTAIFWAKNYDGMSDVQQIEVTAQPGNTAQLTPEEIARQIEQDIPIDADYKEADTGKQ